MKRVRSVYALAAVALSLSLGGAPTPVATTPLMPVSRAGSLEGPSPEFKALRERGIALHDAARDGDGPAARRAVEPLERYLDRFANDGEARAWLGSVYAMMGRDAASIFNKMRYTNRGLRHLDRALDTAPRSFTVRLIRARVNSSLPKMFGRDDEALEDMLALDAMFREDPSPRLVRSMIGIYEALRERAPAAGPWVERLERARGLHAEQRARQESTDARKVPDSACSAPEQHVHGAGAAVGRDRGAEREHFGTAPQPSVDVRLHDRQAVPRTEPLAVDDAHAAPSAAAGVLEKPVERRRGVGHDAPVQIEVRLGRDPSSPQPLHLPPADAAAGEAQHIPRPDVGRPLRLGKSPWTRRFALRSRWGTR